MKTHIELKKKYKKTDKEMIKVYYNCIKYYLSEEELKVFLNKKKIKK